MLALTPNRGPTNANDAASDSHKKGIETCIVIREFALEGSSNTHISKDGITNRFSLSSRSGKKIERISSHELRITHRHMYN